jgi:hypothetical protein
MKSILSIILLSLVGCTADIDASINTDPNPSCQYEVYRHSVSGWLLTNPEMHLVFYGTQWANNYEQEQQYETAWVVMFQNGVLNRLSEYGIHSGSIDYNTYNSNPNVDTITTAGNTTVITSPIVIDDNSIPNQINQDILSGLLPFPNSNTLYTIMLPPNVSTNELIGSDAVGYHRYADYDGIDYAYSVILYESDFNYENMIISHELYESATNSDLTNGYYGVNTDQEIADICLGQYTQIAGYNIQKVFSETSCLCL